MSCLKIHEVPQGEYIYLIQEREFIRCDDAIYKIGKTKQKPYKRMDAYPKGSLLFLTIVVDDCDTAEKDLIAIFKEHYKWESRVGDEYFIGDPIAMMKDIIEYQRDHMSLESIQRKIAARKKNVPENDGIDSDDNQHVDDEPVAEADGVQVSPQKDDGDQSKSVPTKLKYPTLPDVDDADQSTVRKPKSTTLYKSQIKAKSTTTINKICDEIVNIVGTTDCSTDIYFRYYSGLKAFKIRRIDVYRDDTIILVIDANEEIESGHNERTRDFQFLKLTDAQRAKFNKVYDPKNDKYVITIEDLVKRTFKHLKYYRMDFADASNTRYYDGSTDEEADVSLDE